MYQTQPQNHFQLEDDVADCLAVLPDRQNLQGSIDFGTVEAAMDTAAQYGWPPPGQSNFKIT